jgi:RNA polymerase sigma factor (sigma-70 family)
MASAPFTGIGCMEQRTLGELLVAMRDGTPDVREAAWAACYTRFRDVVWTRVFYVIRTIPWLPEPREVAEEVTSDVFVGLPDAVRHYRDDGKGEQWLKKVAVRTALRARERLTGDWQKRGAAPAEPARRGGRTYASFDDHANAIVEQLDAIDRDELLELERRLVALRTSAEPREQRWARFVDLYREGYGFAEIGERMGLTEGTARNWLVAIRRHLATPLPAEAPHD